MGYRVPAPGGKLDTDGRPIMVLPDGTILKGSYHTRFHAVGGQSIVYLAIRDSVRYVLKEAEASNTRHVIALTQEKSTLERLDHSGIVNVYDLFEEDGFCYLVLEYVEGVTLESKIPQSPNLFLSEKVVLDWARQLCDIFEYLHAQNPPVIYRDLKPRNIMVDSTGNLKLIDFGIARVFKEGKAIDTDHLGSIITASPEHYGGAQTDIRSDIYTLGATLHLLLTNCSARGREPFDFPPIRSINPKVSENTEKVVARCLEFKPEDRFQSVTELRWAFFGKRGLTEEEAAQEIAVDTRRLSREELPPGVVLTMEKEPEEEEESKTWALMVVLGFLISFALGILLGYNFLLKGRLAAHPIFWKDAEKYYGQQKVVEGVVVRTHKTPKVIFLNFDRNWEHTFSVVIFKKNWVKWGKTLPNELYLQKKIQVTGKIKEYEGRPEIIVSDPSQIKIIEP